MTDSWRPVGSWSHPNTRKTRCRQGHQYDEANTYRNPTTGKRQCRICNRLEHFRRYWRGRERVAA